MTHVLDAQGRVKRGFSGGGLQYGEIWVKANAVATIIGIAGTFVQFTGFTQNGQSNGTTPDHTNDHIVILTDGIYQMICAICIESVGGGAPDLAALELRKNNGTVRFDNTFHHRRLAGGGGDVGALTLVGMANLSAGDTIELWLTNEDNATNILVCHANLTVVLL